MRTRSGSAGFTLVELVVAMAVFLLFITATFGTYTSVHRAMTQTEAHEDVLQTGRVILAQLSAELASAYQPAADTASELVGEDTEGPADSLQSDSLSFLTTSHSVEGDVAHGDVARVTYSVGDPASGEASGLYVEEDLMPGLEIDEEQPELVLVSPLVVGFNCEYLPADGDWQTEWVDESTLPAAVRVDLSIQDEKGQSPPLVLVSTTNLAMATLPAGDETVAPQ